MKDEIIKLIKNKIKEIKNDDLFSAFCLNGEVKALEELLNDIENIKEEKG